MENKEKQVYMSPSIEVLIFPEEQLLQTVSVTPNQSTSSATPWDAEQEHQGGTTLIGDTSGVAPAKKWGSVWDDDEE